MPLFRRRPAAPAPEEAPQSVLTPELMRQIRRIEIRTRHLVDQSFGGEYHSVFKGRGMAFDEVRPYQPGDEVRTIDWNVTARTGEPHVKRFVEERELTVLLVVDVSASFDVGTRGRFKRDLAAELGAVLAFAATTNHDRVGLVLFSDKVELLVPPRKGRRHVLRLVRELLTTRPTGRGTNVRLALDTANRVLARRGILFLISDFQTDIGRFRTTLAATRRRHDVVAVELTDPLEAEIPAVGLLRLADAEHGAHALVDTSSPRWRAAHAAARAAHAADLTAALRDGGVDRIAVTTGVDYAPALASFFQRRARTRRRAGRRRSAA
ncbi:MAG: DUF58 domain-containing protein [Ardenticatenales bacterium]|nr:DUF58 domain-containing protein [Ardenticatenales bacterium]